jgi:hypothetical protein
LRSLHPELKQKSSEIYYAVSIEEVLVKVLKLLNPPPAECRQVIDAFLDDDLSEGDWLKICAKYAPK